jgi:hypothetical protein
MPRKMNTFAQPTGKVRRACKNLANGTMSREVRAAARLRSEQATSKFRTALRDYQIVQTTHSTTHAANDVKEWTVLFSGVIVARFTDVGTAAQWVADKAKPEPASWNVFGGFFDAMIP